MGQEVRTGVTEWTMLKRFLPTEWVTALIGLPPAQRERAQELRLRADQPVTVSLPEGERYLGPAGLTELRSPGVYFCDRSRLERLFLGFCEDAVYAHEWELQQGYLAVPGGLRVGVAGTAVVEEGQVRSVQAVTSLCVRLPRRVSGCAAALQDWLFCDGRPMNTLLVGEPSGGKTTLLRDLALRLAADHRRVAVVDERGELSGGDGLPGCDVLRGYPKAVGIRQAVRCLAPEIVLFDELGDEAEVRAVAACAHAGVAVVASLHGHSLGELACRPLSRLLIYRQTFARWILLAGRDRPGTPLGCYTPEVGERGIDWIPVDRAGRTGSGFGQRPALAEPGALFDPNRWGAADAAGAVGLHQPPDDGAVAAVGTE